MDFIGTVVVDALWYLCYILPVAGALMLLRLFTNVPDELFRKLLHAAAFSSAPVILLITGAVWITAAVLVAVGAFIWPILHAVENQPWYAGLLVERKAHEIQRSLLLLFWGNALIVGLAWGLFGQAYVAVASILMWGCGDASAALVGKRWGRHRTGLPLADPKKTWEGTGAMWVVSLVVGIVTLTVMVHLPLMAAVMRAALTAAVGAYVELITRNGDDTLTVPAANACVLLLFVLATGV